MTTTVLRILLLAGATVCSAGERPGTIIDAKAAFARLKELAGEWQGNSSMGKTRLTYELIAGGTSLVEREKGERMPEMMTVYHLDGDRLILTHYCMAGNQPRMQARSFDARTGELKFEFLDATNLATQDAGHMRNVTLRLIDNDRMTSAWEFYEGGRSKMTESFEYSRIR
jgi:hypothetical protein